MTSQDVLTRRRFLTVMIKGIGAVTAATATTSVGMELIRSTAQPGRARLELLGSLFDTGGETQAVPGNRNPLQPGVHPDDAWTMRRVGPLFGFGYQSYRRLHRVGRQGPFAFVGKPTI